MKADELLVLYSLFEDHDISIWLDGGWGMSALVGEQIRDHDDVDIVIQKKDLEKMRALLEERGYSDIPRDDTRPWNFVLGDGDQNQIDVHVIELDEVGNGIYGPGENGDAYPANALKGVGIIDGEKVKCLTAEYQLESHSGYVMRNKDIIDVTAVCRKFGLEVPSRFRK